MLVGQAPARNASSILSSLLGLLGFTVIICLRGLLCGAAPPVEEIVASPPHQVRGVRGLVIRLGTAMLNVPVLINTNPHVEITWGLFAFRDG